MRVSLSRWLPVGVLVLLTASALVLDTAAAPDQPVCTWSRLSSGEARAQMSLAAWPEVGAVAYGGMEMRGATADLHDDVHALDLSAGGAGTWQELEPEGSGPEDRVEHSAAVRAVGGVVDMMVHGGQADVPQQGGDGGTFTWRSPLTAGGVVAERRAGAYTPWQLESSTFRLRLASDTATWSAVDTIGRVGVTDHSMVYAPDEDALIVFGGREAPEAASATSDLWRLALDDQPRWMPQPNARGPSARFAHSAVYDAVGARMVVFGGTNDWERGRNDLWALDLSAGWMDASWTRITAQGTPPSARYDHAAVYHPTLRWMVVFGGTTDGQRELSDLHVLDLDQSPPAWIDVEAEGNPPPAVHGLGATYSETGNAIVFYGGQTGLLPDAQAVRNTWSLVCAAPEPPTPTPEDTPTAAPTEEPTDEPATETPAVTDTPTATATPGPTETAEPVLPAPVYMPRLENGIALRP